MPPPLPSKFKPPQHGAAPPVKHSQVQDIRRPPSSRQSIHVYEDSSWRASDQPNATEHDRQRDYSQKASSRLQALPFRPSPSQRTRDIPPFRDADYDPRPDTMRTGISEFHPIQPLSQLSLRSPRDQQGPFHRPIELHDAIPQPRQYEPYRNTTQHNAGYGTAAQQRDDQARQPLQPFSASHLNRQPLQPFSASHLNRQPVFPTRAEDVRATTPPPLPRQSQPQPPTASVISPFFKRGAASRSPSTQRPPTRGSFVRPSYPSLSRDTTTGYRMATPLQPETSHGYSQRPSLHGLSFIERPYRPADHQPLYQSPTRQAPAGDRYTRGSMVPQTPRNSQDLFQRPDYQPMSAVYAPNRPQSTAQRGRISFPPSQQTMSLAGSQEQALSQIRGVRVSSQGVRSQNYESGPLYEPTRTLFSSAGGRRSVRR